MSYDLLAATLAPLATVLPVMLSAVLAFVLVLATAGDRDDTARWEAITEREEITEDTARRVREIGTLRIVTVPIRVPVREQATRAVLVSRYGRRRAAWILAA